MIYTLLKIILFVFFQAPVYMGEDFLVGRTEKGLVTEIARGKESIVQAAAVADMVPVAVLASACSDVLGASIGFGLFDAGQNIGKWLFMQVSV